MSSCRQGGGVAGDPSPSRRLRRTPARAWPENAWRCAALIETGSWSTRELFERYRSQWTELLKGNKTARPTRLLGRISTTLLVNVPIHLADEADWQLRPVKVEDPGEGFIAVEDGWPKAV